MNRLTKLALLLLSSSVPVAVSSYSIAQQNDLRPLVDGRNNPELLEDSLAMDSFVNRVIFLDENKAGEGDRYLNSVLNTAYTDYAGLIALFRKHLQERDDMAAGELRLLCGDTARTDAMSNSELVETLSQIRDTELAQYRYELRRDATRMLGQEKYAQ